MGGTIGYLKKGSKASLIAGLTVGSLMLGSSYLIAKTDRVFEGHALATATSGLLAMAMGQRYMQAGKFMPSGMVRNMRCLHLVFSFASFFTYLTCIFNRSFPRLLSLELQPLHTIVPRHSSGCHQNPIKKITNSSKSSLYQLIDYVSCSVPLTSLLANKSFQTPIVQISCNFFGLPTNLHP